MGDIITTAKLDLNTLKVTLNQKILEINEYNL
jgi:hypothetical protein